MTGTIWLAGFIKALYHYPLRDLKLRLKMLEEKKETVKIYKPSTYNDMLLRSLDEEITVLKEVINDRELWDKVS